jgi:hypothetical protein
VQYLHNRRGSQACKLKVPRHDDAHRGLFGVSFLFLLLSMVEEGSFAGLPN